MNKPSKQDESKGSAPKPSSRSVKSSISESSSKGSKLRRLFQSAFEGWGDEIVGWLLVLGGLLGVLSLYVDRAGVVGQILDDAIGWSVGLIKFILPIAMILLGLLMFREKPESSELSKRMPVGVAFSLASFTGLLHILCGRPGIGDGAEELGSAGGLIGLTTGGSLDSWLGVWAAVLILVVIGFIGVGVTTQTTANQALKMLVAALRPVGRTLRQAATDLFTPPNDSVQEPRINPEPEPEPEPESVPPQNPQIASAPKKRKQKKKPAPDGSEQLKIELGPAAENSIWRLPSSKILSRSTTHDIDEKLVEARGMRLQEALAAHGVETRLSDMTVGPTVTRYALQLGEGVKVARITSLHKDIAYALAAADVRILAPIPGQQAIGIEVPNDDREVVALGDILTSGEATKAKHPLEVGIGRDINGKSVMLNLATMPHLLIAGATGAGKSSCINSLVSSVLMRTTPEQAKLILIDPKRVEMGQYEGVPHLLTAPVTDPRKAANALNWAVKEMERRYDLLSSCGFRDVTGYNAAHARGDLEAPLGVMDENEEPLQYKHLPFILVVVDELADLMMVAARDVEDSICRLAQMARAVGIHLVVATQRPSVNVITGVIKANIPARLAFAVSSLADSRVILDQPGAERLVGKGDMLLLGPSSSTPQRIQGAWVDEEEVRQIVTTWVKQVEAQGEIEGAENDEVTAEQIKSASSISPIGGEIADSITADRSPASGSDDELYEQARQLVVDSQLGSTSMLQRKLRVGFARAGRLMDLLEESGIVGPSTGSKAREVLITAEELSNLQEQGL